MLKGHGNMQKLQKQYTGKGVIWLSIISSAPGKQGYCTGPQAEANRKDQKADPTAVLLDPSGEIGQKYGAKTTPHIFIINPEGVIKTAEIHDNGIGRDAQELLRKVQAAQYVAKNPGQVCPAKWTEGAATLTPSLDLVGKI